MGAVGVFGTVGGMLALRLRWSRRRETIVEKFDNDQIFDIGSIDEMSSGFDASKISFYTASKQRVQSVGRRCCAALIWRGVRGVEKRQSGSSALPFIRKCC